MTTAWGRRGSSHWSRLTGATWVAGVTALGSALPAAAQTPSIWDPNADLLLTMVYASTERITLADFLVGDAVGVTFALGDCDSDWEDYFDAVMLGATGTADAGKLVVTVNSRGHVHSVRESTACTVTATRGGGSEDGTFELRIASQRTPAPMHPLAVQGVSSETVTVRITRGTHPLVRLRIRDGTSGEVTFYVVRNVVPDTDLIFTELTPDTSYEIAAARMRLAGFHLWGGEDDQPAGALVEAAVPNSVWSGKLGGRGVGKSAPAVSARTLEKTDPDPGPGPGPVPALPPAARLILAVLLGIIGKSLFARTAPAPREQAR